MAKLENTIECIETLMDTMNRNGMAKLEYSCEEFDLKIEAPDSAAPAPVCIPYPQSSGTVQTSAADFDVKDASCTCNEPLKGNLVRSPIVGTYYNAPAPGKPPFVSVGQNVKKGDVLMIIESMKLMNEIQSEFDGVIAEIMVADGTAVEFEQPLMRIV